jgi:hypothetical protein
MRAALHHHVMARLDRATQYARISARKKLFCGRGRDRDGWSAVADHDNFVLKVIRNA